MVGASVREAESAKLIRCNLGGGGKVKDPFDLDIKAIKCWRNLNLQVVVGPGGEDLHVVHAVGLEVDTEGEVWRCDWLSSTEQL